MWSWNIDRFQQALDDWFTGFSVCRGLPAGQCQLADGDRSCETGRRLDAVILEELATFCLIKLSSELEKLGAQEAERMDLSISGSLNPGDHDGFALSTQELILKMANADSIGVVLTSAQMMSPQHSLSVVYGLGQLMPGWTQLENCSNCGSRNKCPHVLALEA